MLGLLSMGCSVLAWRAEPKGPEPVLESGRSRLRVTGVRGGAQAEDTWIGVNVAGASGERLLGAALLSTDRTRRLPLIRTRVDGRDAQLPLDISGTRQLELQFHDADDVAYRTPMRLQLQLGGAEQRIADVPVNQSDGTQFGWSNWGIGQTLRYRHPVEAHEGVAQGALLLTDVWIWQDPVQLGLGPTLGLFACESPAGRELCDGGLASLGAELFATIYFAELSRVAFGATLYYQLNAILRRADQPSGSVEPLVHGPGFAFDVALFRPRLAGFQQGPHTGAVGLELLFEYWLSHQSELVHTPVVGLGLYYRVPF